MEERAVIFVNGAIPDPDLLGSVIQAGDFLVAADGGMNHLRRLSLQPHMVVGDLDSIPPADKEKLAASGVELVRAPAEKDETDLELAIQQVIKRGFENIVIVGALGDRVDHTLGNIYLLGLPELDGMEVCLDDGQVNISLVRSSKQISGRAGDLVSLLPFNGPAVGVRTSGLYYPLQGETLEPFYTRGISNLMTQDSAAVSVVSGWVLCIHTRKFNRG